MAVVSSAECIADLEGIPFFLERCAPPVAHVYQVFSTAPNRCRDERKSTTFLNIATPTKPTALDQWLAERQKRPPHSTSHGSHDFRRSHRAPWTKDVLLG